MDALTSQFIADLYGSALERRRITGVVDGLRAMLAAPVASLTHLDSDLNCLGIVNRGSPDWCERRYIDRYASLDIFAPRTGQLERGRAYFRRDVIGGDELYDSALYKGFLRFTGGEESINGLARLGDGVLLVSASRLPGRPPFGEAERALLERLLPHFEAAARIGSALHDARLGAAVLDGYQRLDTAMALLDRRGELLFANKAAAALLAGRDAGLRLDRGRLAATADVAARLERLLEAAGRQPGAIPGGLRIDATDGAGGLMLLALPLGETRSDLPDGAAVLLLILDPDSGTPRIEAQLRALFGLTRTEARIAAGIAGGRSVEELAAAMSVSHYTVRFHLKGVYAKMNARRQADIARIVGRTLALVRWDDDAFASY